MNCHSIIVLSLVILFRVSFSVCKDTRDARLSVENGESGGNTPASPVLLMLSEMMNKNSNSAKSASLKELQKQVELDRSHIQKIPKRSQEKIAIEERRELEEKERELEENLVLSPEYNKYSYKSAKRPSISYSVGSVCELATCYKDGKPFVSIHNYCYNGITDLQSACEQRYLSVRHRRDFAGEDSPVKQAHNVTSGGTCVAGSTWKENCNDCFCLASGLPACTRMCCPGTICDHGTEEVNVRTKARKNTVIKAEDEQQEAPFDPKKPPNSIDHECTPNSKWQEDCNECVCTEDGFGKICTTDMCMEENSDAVTAPQPCMPGTTWKEDCNDCFCTFVGAPSCSLVSC